MLPLLFVLILAYDNESSLNGEYKEKWRPQYHFTPPKNWMNDPNGLSYFNGYYHMFFQYNEEGIIIGNQSWGHSVSKDMVFWEYVGVPIKRFDQNFIFSGCAVVFNDSLNAVYTVYHEIEDKNTGEKKIIEDEYLSVSKDGFNFEFYPNNPILTHHTNQLQDPKIFKYSSSSSNNKTNKNEYFVMSIAIPDQRTIQFYKSIDLINWTYLSEFSKQGSTEYHWEMPVLTKIETCQKSNSISDLYLLIINVGYYAQYFIGTFDGTKFSPSKNNNKKKNPKFRLVDYGPDFFETQTFYQSEKLGKRVILIANIVNYHYALQLPTTKWRNTQTLPRELCVVENNDDGNKNNFDFDLIQKPIDELSSLRIHGEKKEFHEILISSRDTKIFEIEFSKTMEIKINEIICKNNCKFEIYFNTNNNNNKKQKMIIGYENDNKTVYLNREYSGLTNFSKYYQENTIYRTPSLSSDGINNLHIFIDWSTVEIFINDGLYSLTAVMFPEEYSNVFEIYNLSEDDKFNNIWIKNLTFWGLSSIHD